MKHIRYSRFLFTILAAALTAGAAFAQTTTINYQGRLTDTGTPQSNYQMQFELYDAVVGGNRIGATIVIASVAVTQSVFTVQLDFGAAAFDGSDRFLEVAVKRAAGDSFTVLAPRQHVTSAPTAIRSLNAGLADNANQLGGVNASEYVTTNTVSNSFIKNDTAQQTGNFSISGIGTVGDSFGIGTTPNSGFKFDMIGNSRLTTANGAVITFASPNSESGMSTIFNGGRADLRFNGTTVKLVAGQVGGPPSDFSGIAVTTTGNVGVGTTTPQAKLHVAGNAVQDRDKGGMVKAMLAVAADGTILRCYNGTTGSSAGNCGFTVTAGANGNYTVDVGFQVNDRFLSVAAQGINGTINIPPVVMNADFRFSSLPNANPNVVIIDTFRADTGATVNNPFILIVY